MKSYSDGYLNSVWRKAVWILWGKRCPFCGRTAFEQVQIHHIIHRKDLLLRWDYRNGIPACPFPPIDNADKFCGKTCHQYADTEAGREEVRYMLGKEKWEYLKEIQLKTSKQYFVEKGITRDEFTVQKYEELKKIIGSVEE